MMFLYYTLHSQCKEHETLHYYTRTLWVLLAQKSNFIYLKSLNEMFCFVYTRHCFNASLVCDYP